MGVNIELVQKYLADHSPEFVTEDAVLMDVPSGAEIAGPDAIGSWLYELYHVAFPGSHADDPKIHAGADSVVVEFTFKGRNDGPFAGNPPSHRSVSVPMCVVYEIEGSDTAGKRITSIKAYYDSSTMMRQLTG